MGSSVATVLLKKFVTMSNRFFLCNLWIIFIRGKTDHNYRHGTVHFFKKSCFVAFSVENL